LLLPRTLRQYLEPYAPWRAGVSPLVIAVQGAIALGVGLYLLIATGHAAGTITQIVGAYLAVVSAVPLIAVLRDPADVAGRPTALLRRLIGLVGGSLALLSPWLGLLSLQNARLALAGAFVLGGLIAIYGAFTDPQFREIRWGVSLSGLVDFAIGVVFYIATDPDRPLLSLLGVLLILAAGALVARAFWINPTYSAGQQ
jgi:uncharacterized membrane protein HdeD (DUF308 family)